MKQLIYIGCIGMAISACNPAKNNQMVNSSAIGATPTSNENGKLKSIDVAYLDQSVKPQEDFFQFANGTWCKNNPVPNSESRWGSFNELDKQNKTVLRDILTKAANENATKGSQNQILGDYFSAFLDVNSRTEKGYGAIKDRISKIESIHSREDIARIVAEQHKVGIRSLFGFGVGQDLKNVDKNVVYMGQGGLGLPNRDYYFKENKEQIRAEYVKFIAKMYVATGVSEEKAAMSAQRIFKFETLLAEKMMSPEEARLPEKTYNLFNFQDTKKRLSNFAFEDYLTILGSQSFDSLIVSQPEYLSHINSMMKDLPMESWIEYLKWKTINHYASAMGEKFEQINFAFYGGVLSGKKEMKPRDDRAIDEITNQAIGELLGKAFVERTFSKNAQARVNKMVDNLLLAFQERIKGLEWMSDDTKKEALTKLNAIGRKLGCPDEWRDFSKLEISKTDYIANLDNCAKFETIEELGKLYKPVNRKEWGMPAHMVNAYYHPLLNEIAFPAGIMQPPFFDENAEDAVNYGRIGMVIGHEFTHGFDDNGSKFAADGSYTNWWKETDRSLFEERTKTLGATFSNFCPIEGNCVNPELTMGENIADLGGLTMAFYAYKMTDEFKKGELIDGFTPAQRFFIAYAQLWKINYTEAELKNRIATDSHSPGMFRVNGPLMNCPEFFEAFQVKEGDKMRNPAAKVAKIW
jgi:putative endopeptidase